jgi:hypothetical protein
MRLKGRFLFLSITDENVQLKMVLQTGASEAEHLLSIAKDSYTSSDKDVADVTSSRTTCEETSCLKKKFENIEENGQLVNKNLEINKQKR